MILPGEPNLAVLYAWIKRMHEAISSVSRSSEPKPQPW